VIYIILTPRAGGLRLKRNVPGPWINTGRKWGLDLQLYA